MSVITIGAVAGISFIAGIIVWNFGLGSFFTSDEHLVSVEAGISLEEAITAFGDESAMNSLGIQNVFVFSKSGGKASGGQLQPVLRVDLPANVSLGGKDVSFQYFVDVRNDMNKQTAAHCGDVRLHVFLDSKEIFVSSWLGYDGRNPTIPLDTAMIVLHDVPAGVHEIGLIPEARPGGCNPGFIQSWGGTAVLFK
jgi:hypothetical protein